MNVIFKVRSHCQESPSFIFLGNGLFKRRALFNQVFLAQFSVHAKNELTTMHQKECISGNKSRDSFESVTIWYCVSIGIICWNKEKGLVLVKGSRLRLVNRTKVRDLLFMTLINP